MTDWIEWKWTEEKPYPETLDTLIYVKCSNGFDDSHMTDMMSVNYWYGSGADGNGFDPRTTGHITHYKLAEPAND